MSRIRNTLYSVFFQLNIRPQLDKCQGNQLRYLVDSDLSSGQHYPPFEQLGPGLKFNIMTCMLLSIQDRYNIGEEIRSKTVPCLCRGYSCRPMITTDHICFLNDQNYVFPHSYAPTLINILSCPQYTRTNVSRDNLLKNK